MDAPRINDNNVNGDNPAASAPVKPCRVRKFPRSKDGCLTCKYENCFLVAGAAPRAAAPAHKRHRQRKVKCDESQPRCSHCERLNIHCRWRNASRNGVQGRQAGASSSAERTPMMRTPTSPSSGANNSPGLSLLQSQPQAPPVEIFDYASFVWGGRELWPQPIPDLGQGVNNFDPHPIEPETENQIHNQASHTSHSTQVAPFRAEEPTHEPSEPSSVSDTTPQANQDVAQESGENHDLIQYFIHAVTPPILSEVEAHKNWITMRKILIKMAGDSRMVRWAVLAFSNVMLCRRDGDWMASQQNHYADAAAEVALYDQDARSLVQHSARREKLLATLFFLSYVDILESRIDAAHSHLKRAYKSFQQAQKGSFASVKKQFLLWLRLLDARAVAAGGEGLFLAQDNEELLVQTSPASYNGEEASKNDFDDDDIEDEIFRVLYQPGYAFFQKVQSFTGHIAKIDPWHRSRGTVEDETEVMIKAAEIATDLRALYEQRPSFFAVAVAGKLTATHVSAHLAFTITRTFRTYLANYYATKIHLHRVAYKTLPLTAEALDAMDNIRRLTKLIAEGLDGDDPLPVNMLWPLLMLGTEEQDLESRAWIKSCILRMEKIAGNARITAQVLEEVQARQDTFKMRVDVGLVMSEIFNLRFAVV